MSTHESRDEPKPLETSDEPHSCFLSICQEPTGGFNNPLCPAHLVDFKKWLQGRSGMVAEAVSQVTQADWDKWYADAQKDSGLYAGRFVQLYEFAMVCTHKRPSEGPHGVCKPDCFKVEP